MQTPKGSFYLRLELSSDLDIGWIEYSRNHYITKKKDDSLLRPLFNALFLGEYDLVNQLICSHIDVTKEPELLIQAIFSKARPTVKAQLIELLISKGADVTHAFDNDDENFYLTPLSAAVITGCSDTIRLLIRNGADCCDHLGYEYLSHPLECACYMGNLEVVESLIEYRPMLSTCSNDDWVSAALEKIICGVADNETKAQAINMLLAKRTNTDFNINTLPIAKACKFANPYLLSFLLKLGAPAVGIFQNGCSLMHAISNQYQFTILNKYGQRDVKKEKEEEEARFNNSVECARILIENGADVNISDIYGYLPLDMACNGDNPNPQLVRFLLENGAEITTVNYGRPPLHTLCSSTDPFPEGGGNAEEKRLFRVMDRTVECAKILIEYGADVNERDYHGLEPLHLACNLVNPNPLLIQFLLEKGAHVNATTNCDRTALHILCDATIQGLMDEEDSEYDEAEEYEGQPEEEAWKYEANEEENKDLSKEEVEEDVDLVVERQSEVKGRQLECLKILLKHGADVNCCDMFGNLPFVMACEAGKRDFMDILLAHQKLNNYIFLEDK